MYWFKTGSPKSSDSKRAVASLPTSILLLQLLFFFYLFTLFLEPSNRDPHSFVSKKILSLRPSAVGLVGARSRTRMINNCSRLQWRSAFFSHHDWSMTMKWTSNEKWCHRQSISPLQDRVPNVQRADDEYLDIENSLQKSEDLYSLGRALSFELVLKET